MKNYRVFLLAGLGWLLPLTSHFAAPPASEVVDRLVEAKLKEQGIEPNPLANDEVFVRRIYLDIAGRIPTHDEAITFLSDPHENKRERLINALMESEAYVLNFANYWADILRAKDRITGAGNSLPAGRAYNEYIRESLRENKPYDEWVRELVTASGNIWNQPQVGYYLRDYGMPLDNLAITAQTFLGTRIVCAQCHDHPFDTWTQMDYYHLAAFTNGMVTSNQSPNARAAIALFQEREEKKGRKLSNARRKEVSQAFSEILKPVRFTQVYEMNRPLRLPHDYQYDDAKAKDRVFPKVPFAPGAVTSELDPRESPIHVFAEWLTSPQNPRFTRVMANRLWKKSLGIGVIDPVDDLREDTEPTNPELMDYLENRLKGLDYDMKRFLRIIYNSKTYQREATLEQPSLGEKYYFPGPVLRRMTAEQIWDSFLALTIDEVDERDLGYEIFAARQVAATELIANAVHDQNPSDFLRDARKIVNVQRALADELEQTQVALAAAREAKDVAAADAAVSEAQRLRRKLALEIEEIVYRPELAEKVTLVVSNDPDSLTVETLGETGSSSRELLADLAEVLGEQVSFEAFDTEESLSSQILRALFQEQHKELRAQKDALEARQIEAWGVKSKSEKASYKSFKRANIRLRRATYVGSPAPPGHFLREFGQSDRELVENASDDAAVTQALSLLNGPEVSALMGRYSVLSRGMVEHQGLDQRLNYLYRSLLGRKPTDHELSLLTEAYSKELGSGAIAGTVWTLLNTRQFLFIQ